MTAIDYFSRFAFAKVIKQKTSEIIVKFYEIVHSKLNIQILISDGARENTSEEIGNWVTANKINHHITSAYHHCSNGRIERFNRTIGEAIKKQNNQIEFSKKVENAIKAYNYTIHSALNLKPNEALLFENLDIIKKHSSLIELKGIRDFLTQKYKKNYD